MVKFDIPGFGQIRLEHVVSDFTGTISVDGSLLPGVREHLQRISESLTVHILTADTFGTARSELEGVNCEMLILSGEYHDAQKEQYVKRLGAEKVVALGNGNNDRKMLAAARIGIAVCLKEGCSTDAVKSADIVVFSAIDALELLLSPKRLTATLRF